MTALGSFERTKRTDMILGILPHGHDPSVALIDDDGRPVAVYEWERIFGERYCMTYSAFSFNSMMTEYPRSRHMREADAFVDRTTVFWDKYAKDITGVGLCAGVYTKDHIYLEHCRCLLRVLRERYGEHIPQHPVLFNHHECHASVAFYSSPFEEAKVFSFDGAGNDGFTKLFHASENTIKHIAGYKDRFGHSYNLLGRRIGDYEEFWPIPAISGRLMGLSSYGKFDVRLYDEAKAFFEYVSRYVWLSPLGWKELMVEYDQYTKNDQPNLYHLGESDGWLAKNYVHSFQQMWTDRVIEILKQHIVKDEPLCLSGGCAMNGIANHAIFKEVTSNLYIPPNPGDCGLALGAAFAYRQWFEQKPRNYFGPISPYIGVPILDTEKLDKYRDRDDYKGKVTLKEIAKHLANGKILGVIQGNSEIGPRALGNRSILADCRKKEVKDRLNEEIKFRAWYRPYAPVVRQEDVDRYFEFNAASPYMSQVVKVKSKVKDDIPGVTHVDDTARLQTVTRQQHRWLYDLLTEYEKSEGIGVLLNTSFNSKGRPMVTKLKTAFDTLDSTGLDGVIVEGKELWLKSVKGTRT